MKQINFIKDHIQYWCYEGKPLKVDFYRAVYTDLTSQKAYFKVKNMDETDLPGLSLQEWLEASEMTYTAFARLVPCAPSYPRLLAQGLARPSYAMACRIERVTGGAVPRDRWFPPSPETSNKPKPGKTLEDV